jgi:hypothetical protein
MGTAARSVSRNKVCAHRARLREQGLRPVQIWVHGVRFRVFARAAHRVMSAHNRGGRGVKSPMDDLCVTAARGENHAVRTG